jgi:two-component system NarL family response regulator
MPDNHIHTGTKMDATPPDRPIRVLLVDDHWALRDGLGLVIGKEPDMRLVGEAATGEQAIEQFQRLMPDITVMDIGMPGICGVTAMQQIRRDFPNAKIIILTTYRGDVRIKRALESGAAGFILKSASPQEFAGAIRAVHRGERRITPEAADELAKHMDAALLSEREIEVLNWVAGGNSNKRIAARLFISEDTVKAHMRNVLAKLNASDRTHAVTIGLKRGIISFERVELRL